MSRRRTINRSSSLTVEDWIQAACQAIEAEGVGAVAVEPLAKKLGVTKGSFYWHFPNRDALLTATLEWWEKACTEAVIAVLEQIADPRERLERLAEEATTEQHTSRHASAPEIFFSHGFELAISDAADDPIVSPILRRVTERRLDYLEACYRALGLPPEAAPHRAVLVYAAYMGTLRLLAREARGRVPQGDDYRAYQRHFIATLVPAVCEKSIHGSESLD